MRSVNQIIDDLFGYAVEDKYRARIRELVLEDSVARAVIFSYFLVPVFTLYGITSIDFLAQFNPSITLWLNLWPRFLLNSLPIGFLGLIISKVNWSYRNKLFAWILGFSVIFHIGAWIHVWPLAISGKPVVLAYVNAANTYLFAFLYVVVSPPIRYVGLFTAVLFTVFIAPLFVLAYWCGDMVIFKLLVNDSVFTIMSGTVICSMVQTIRVKLAVLEMHRQEDASKFLGPVVSKAIFQDREDLLGTKKKRGFVVSIDIRDSTELQKAYKDRWLDLQTSYFSLVTRSVAKHNGYIQKTIGDCHVINFGVMDEDADPSDIPGIETEVATAEDRRLQRASDSAFKCMDEIFSQFSKVTENLFPEVAIRLGGGMDKGIVERKIQGDQSLLLELDVNGEAVNCCSRLQEYSKEIRSQFDLDSSLFVISPFAADYVNLKQMTGFKKLSTQEKQIRNFPNIRWVLVREFKSLKVRQSQAA